MMSPLLLALLFGTFSCSLSKLAAVHNGCLMEFGYSPSTRKCYSFGKTRQNFNMAQLSCKRIGGRLLQVQDEMELGTVAGLANIYLGQGTLFWIGASMQNSRWQWQNGRHFRNSSFNLPDRGRCAFAYDINLGSANCDYELWYICESDPILSNRRSKRQLTTPPPNYTPPVPFCPPDWHYYQEANSCYSVKYRKNWDSAERECVKDQAHLVSIHSETENLFVSTLSSLKAASEGHQGQTWLGLYRPSILPGDHKYGWRWTDGTKADFIYWDTSLQEPNNGAGSGDEDCAQMYTDLNDGRKHKWNDYFCSSIMRAFVCKRSIVG